MSGIATAKAILGGEHGVVYGLPAIAFPIFPLKVRISAESQDIRSALILNAPALGGHWQLGEKAEGDWATLACAVEESLKSLGVTGEGLTLNLQSDIPLGSGLGSSAAVSIALIRAIFSAYGTPLSTEILIDLAMQSEAIAHGRPSGLDVQVIAREKPIWFRRGQEPEDIQISGKIPLLIAWSGQPSPTRELVEHVHHLYISNPWAVDRLLEQMEAAVSAMREALEKGDLDALGAAMNDNQTVLDFLQVSSPSLAHLIVQARRAGSPGAKLSGAGRGGIILAIAPPDRRETIQNALERAGARQIWYHELGGDDA